MSISTQHSDVELSEVQQVGEAYFPYPVQSQQFLRVWQKFRKEFRCQKCAGCCSGSIGITKVAVTKEDIHEVAFARRVSVKSIKRLTIVDGNKRYFPTPCPMLEGNECSVYEYRPKSCRTFPWVEDTIVKGIRCPTLNTGCPAVKGVYGFDKSNGVQETSPNPDNRGDKAE